MIVNRDTLFTDFRRKIIAFQEANDLPGIKDHESLECLIEQMIDSVRRIDYIKKLESRDISSSRLNPSVQSFDPVRAAIFYKKNGNINEAFWITFLLTHFSKNIQTSWGLLRAVYSGLGQSIFWNWEKASADPEAFGSWIDEYQLTLKKKGRFGNHRKYESLKLSHTGRTIASYIDWVGENHNHEERITKSQQLVGINPKDIFDNLYKSMGTVERFGRTAKFDYLTMLGKLGLADIEPGSAYLKEATGPLKGARLLFGGSKSANLSPTQLENKLKEFGNHLDLYFGMQVLEDSLCNWQKKPKEYTRFKG